MHNNTGHNYYFHMITATQYNLSPQCTLVWYSWIPALLCHVYHIQGKINQLLNSVKNLRNHFLVFDQLI